MNVTVLLLSVDEAPMLERSLPAALAQQPSPEVVVIDNACADATAELAAAHGVHRIALTPRHSYAAALNAAIAATGGEAVLFLNADCFLHPGFLAAALPRLAEVGVGSVAPKLLRATAGTPSQIDAAAMFIDRRRKNGLVGHGCPALSHARPAPAFGADGAAALYRRETLAACRLGEAEVFDQDMALWASDADLAWRAQLLGWRSVYEPAAVAEHVRTYSPSTRAQLGEDHRRLQFRNRYLMMIKNETAAGLARDLGPIALYELLALGHVVLRERQLLGGYRDAWRLRAAARQRRRQVQQRHRQAQASGSVGPGPPFGLRPPL
ncbi:MAG: glycosyltransferase family 2 protein [Solirubrobacteraceae bacterium]